LYVSCIFIQQKGPHASTTCVCTVTAEQHVQMSLQGSKDDRQLTVGWQWSLRNAITQS